MPIETNLNVAPYFDDYSPDSDYYKILFRPGVALQARELTQLQSILQNQIEKFGNNIFKSGTIISGVNFQYLFKYDYVKILDLQVDGQPVALASYQGLYAKNSANLVARIINYRTGFQSRDPDTNFLYFKYVNAGSDGNTAAFSPDDVLTIYSDAYKLYDFNVVNGGTGFSNSDSVQITSALIVSNSNISAGGNAYQVIGSNTANVYVIESNSTFGTITVGNTSYSSGAGYTLLKIKPINADLSNGGSAEQWNIRTGYNMAQGSNSAYVAAKIGTGATATLTTDSTGIITDVSVVSPGSDYDILPYVSVKTNTGTLTNLNIVPFNYKAQVTVASASFNASNTTPIGNGYAFGVTGGIIYHKGTFIKVNPQTLIVNAYSSNVDSVTVGFETIETVVNSSADESLLDLATGTPNFAAPGANRLKLTPTLTLIDSANVAANNTFMPLVEFRSGEASKEYSLTQYNVINKEFARRTKDVAGNFVVDEFIFATKDKATANVNYVDAIVDPGLAYINGYRVRTLTNSFIDLRRGTDTKSTTSRSISLNYGNYILADEFVGDFNFKAGSEVRLYSGAVNYISGRLTSISPAGSLIGYAKVRSILLDSGIPGTSTARYRVYLFDVVMEPGRSFKNVRSVTRYNGSSYTGICDVVLTENSLTGTFEAVLQDANFNTLVFPVGLNAIKSTSDRSYTSRTSASANIASTGVFQTTVTGDKAFAYGNTLNTIERRNIILTPTANAESNVTLTVSVTSSSSLVTGTGLSANLNVGDYVKITNDSDVLIRQVSSVSNSTAIALDSTYPYSSNATAQLVRYFPAFAPIALDGDLVTANVSSTGQTLSIDIGTTIAASTSATITYDLTQSPSSPVTKNITRNLFVKLSMANNAAGSEGPWNLGIPDGFRLNNVYIAGDSSVNTASTNVTRYFYLDNGQKDGFYGHAKLGLLQKSSYAVTSSDWLLVDFDAFNITQEGYFTADSYTTSNTGSISSLGNTAINILEIPEFTDSHGKYFDLRNCIDFRPYASNTAIRTSNVALASVNPVVSSTLNGNDKQFPSPDTIFIASYINYLPRIDLLCINQAGLMQIVEGISSEVNPKPSQIPTDTMVLAVIDVPAFPSLPLLPNGNTVAFVAKSTGTGRISSTRASNHTIGKSAISVDRNVLQTKQYTMKDIADIDKRLQSIEYYTSLNQLEQRTKDLIIPSSIDGTNRFKNGFFVDQFLDYSLSDLSNPEYSAFIDQSQGMLYPPDVSVNLMARFDYTDPNVSEDAYNPNGLAEPGLASSSETDLMLPYEEVKIMEQSKFTGLVGGDGSTVKFIGDMSIDPPAFKVLVRNDLGTTSSSVSSGSSGGGDIFSNVSRWVSSWW